MVVFTGAAGMAYYSAIFAYELGPVASSLLVHDQAGRVEMNWEFGPTISRWQTTFVPVPMDDNFEIKIKQMSSGNECLIKMFGHTGKEISMQGLVRDISISWDEGSRARKIIASGPELSQSKLLYSSSDIYSIKATYSDILGLVMGKIEGTVDPTTIGIINSVTNNKLLDEVSFEGMSYWDIIDYLMKKAKMLWFVRNGILYAGSSTSEFYPGSVFAVDDMTDTVELHKIPNQPNSWSVQSRSLFGVIPGSAVTLSLPIAPTSNLTSVVKVKYSIITREKAKASIVLLQSGIPSTQVIAGGPSGAADSIKALVERVVRYTSSNVGITSNYDGTNLRMRQFPARGPYIEAEEADPVKTQKISTEENLEKAQAVITAEPAAVFAGDGYGIKFPNYFDTRNLFLRVQGDPLDVVPIGQIWSKADERPPVLEGDMLWIIPKSETGFLPITSETWKWLLTKNLLESKCTRGFKVQAGNSYVTGKERPGEAEIGKYIIIGEDSVILQDKLGNKIEVGSAGIIIQAISGAKIELNGTIVKFNGGSTPMARVGDSVSVDPGTHAGTITSGNSNVVSNWE